ncbi:hypothetical protein BJY00DRAFT_18147 [Aspergillus carlsbadensis]|nr:hypothetical protein BJY00DRAFT_18147 [Aspergillus carlsbadensis]
MIQLQWAVAWSCAASIVTSMIPGLNCDQGSRAKRRITHEKGLSYSRHRRGAFLVQSSLSHRGSEPSNRVSSLASSFGPFIAIRDCREPILDSCKCPFFL